jgi:hypothetical protein
MANSTVWQVQDLTQYNNFSLHHTQDTALSASLLIPLDSHHRHTGAFRLVVYGGDVETVPIPLEDVFPAVPDQLKGLFLNLPCSSDRLRLPNNSTACPWEDAVLMIRNVKSVTRNAALFRTIPYCFTNPPFQIIKIYFQCRH